MAKAQRPRQRPGTTSTTTTPVRPEETVAVAPERPVPVVPATRYRPWGVVAQVARCGFVVLAAGVLVGGDLGTSEAARQLASAQHTGSSAPALGGLSIRVVEGRQQAVSSRTEALAVARAALEAAAAADALSRSGAVQGPLEVRAGLRPATVAVEPTGTEPVLTPEQSATLQALQSAVEVPALPAPLERMQVVRGGSVDGTRTDGRRLDTSTGDDVDGAPVRPGSADDAPSDDGSADDAPAGEALTDDGWTDDSTEGSTDDASTDDGWTDDTSTDDAWVDESAGAAATADAYADPATAGEAGRLAEAVARLTALVAAAGGGSLVPDDVVPVGTGTAVVGTAVDPSAAPVAPVDTPAVDVTPEASSGSSGSATTTTTATATGDVALTDAVSDAAGEVFSLALQVEAAAQPAPLEVVSTESVLAELGQTTASTLEAAEALVGIEPMTAAERADRRPVTVRAPSRPATGASPLVAGLSSRWSNGQIPAEAMCEVEFDPRHMLQCDAAEALGDLNEAYRVAFGHDMRLTDSYRSLAGQIAVKQAKPSLAATPGTSNHGWGLAIDIAGIGGLGQFDSPGYLWLKEHAEDFGWHHPRGMEPGGSSPQEPWHWEFGTD